MSRVLGPWVCFIGCSQALSKNGRDRGRLVKIGLPDAHRAPVNVYTPPMPCPHCAAFPHNLPPSPIQGARRRRQGESVDIECPHPLLNQARRRRLCRRCHRRLLPDAFATPQRRICKECDADD